MNAPHDHDGGLAADLPRLLTRRRALGLFGGLAGMAALAACGRTGSTAAAAPTATDTTGTGPTGFGGPPPGGGGGPGGEAIETVAAGEIPAETAGPYPGDGSNGPNVLSRSGVVRKDLRSSFGGASGTATGVPLTIRLTLTDHSAGSAPLAGAAVYLWHCDAQGRYSLYSQGVTDQNWLRGVQVADSNGIVEFTTIFPGCYSGRWPHAHFEVYPDVASATKGTGRLRTTQLALPEATCKEVYATPGYESSAPNLANISLATDTVFSDGWTLELGTATGSNEEGWTVNLAVPV